MPTIERATMEILSDISERGIPVEDKLSGRDFMTIKVPPDVNALVREFLEKKHSNVKDWWVQLTADEVDIAIPPRVVESSIIKYNAK